jgi:hypothetical protein
MSMPYGERALLALIRRRGLDSLALRALRRASELLGLAIGMRLAELREAGEPFLDAACKAEERSVLLRLAEETIDLLAARWDQVPPRHRRHRTAE